MCPELRAFHLVGVHKVVEGWVVLSPDFWVGVVVLVVVAWPVPGEPEARVADFAAFDLSAVPVQLTEWAFQIMAGR